MTEADLILYLERGLGPDQWRDLARGLGRRTGIREAGPVARAGGRLLHVRYDPTVLGPGDVARAADGLGCPGRVAAL